MSLKAASSRLPVVVTAALAALAACAEAGGEVSGGELSPAGAAAIELPVVLVIENKGEGTKWSDLYRDLFGPTGRAGSCVLRPSCHGPGGDGAKSGSGIECYDEKKCWQSMFDKRQVKQSNRENPDQSGLLAGTLRVKNDKGELLGIMPKDPGAAYFKEESLARVRQWIRDGAKDD